MARLPIARRIGAENFPTAGRPAPGWSDEQVSMTLDQKSAPVLVIGGPTATGKSALAVALAERLNGEVINGDSMQVYRGLPILTAQPDAATRARAPHRLYGELELDERCSAGRWQSMAIAAIGQARAAGRVPIVVGGTGLYLRALMGGLADIPDMPAELRAEITQQLDEMGAAAFHAAFAKQDPEMAARLMPTDRQRLIRAAEVLAATRRSLADWQRETRPATLDGAPLTFRTVLVSPPREALYAACDARFAAMIGHGAIEEARGAAEQGLSDALPGMKALGLRELMAHVRGETDLDEAVRRAQSATRHYAKRQVTWFSRQFITDYLIEEKLSERRVRDSIPIVIKFFLTPEI
jgi:tRNA dimethylallyltransferase